MNSKVGDENKFAISISPFIKVETRKLERSVSEVLEGMDAVEELVGEDGVFQPVEKGIFFLIIAHLSVH